MVATNLLRIASLPRLRANENGRTLPCRGFCRSNEAAVVSAGVRMHICACNGVSDISIIVSTHDNARNAGLKLELARPATESNGAVARVACRCAGGTLLPFGVRDSRRARVRRNDTARRTHEFAQVDGTRNHGIVLHHRRARPTTKSDGVAARAACKCTLDSTLLLFGIHASYRVRIWGIDAVPRTQEFRYDSTGTWQRCTLRSAS